MPEKQNFNIPKEILEIDKVLKSSAFGSYLIGGCVRDLLLDLKPRDWDFTTNAKPDDIIKLFSKTFYENEYGTVGVVNESTIDKTLEIVEITPYRLEAGYSDSRRPDAVSWSDKLEDDLKRRDFTVNAIALHINGVGKSGEIKFELVDLYKGQADIAKKIIRAVGNPDERLQEDALRSLRAIRLSAELDFKIEAQTALAIKKNSALLKKIAPERIREEFVRIIMSPKPMESLILSHELGVLQYIIPELERAIGIKQNQAHAFDVWEHLLRSVQHAADKGWSLEIRLAALLHDISKPETRRFSPEKKDWTFHGHEVVGARVAGKILERLKFPKKTIETITKLIRAHMFFSDTEQITLSAVRRLVVRVGQENVWDLMNVRICDRIGTGRPKENPYRLRKYKSMVEQVMRDPISVNMLKIDGRKIMEVTKLQPGPKIGQILHALLEEVLEDPKLNTEVYLENRALELSKLKDKKLQAIGELAKARKDVEEDKEIKELRKKYYVE